MNSNPLPKKKLREAFHAAKLDKKVNELLSAAYLLHSAAYCFYDEADEVLKANGIAMAQTKQLNIDLRRAYNRYFKDFAELIERTDAGAKDPSQRTCSKAYFADLEKYTPVLLETVRHILALDIKEVEEAIEKDKQEAKEKKL